MRLLVISDLYPPQYIGGYELNCWEHVNQLRKRGHQVTVLTSWYGREGPVVEPYTHRVLRYLAPPAAADAGRRRLEMRQALEARRNRRQAADLMGLLKPDLVYAWNTEHVSTSPVLAAIELGLPVVYRLEDPHLARLWAETGAGRSWPKRTYRRLVNDAWELRRLESAALWAVSASLCSEHVSAGVPSQSLSVIPEGVPAAMVVAEAEVANRSMASSLREAHLLFAGRLVPEKGADVAIRALGRLTEGGGGCPRLDIVGRGAPSHELELRRLVSERGLGEHIRFLGPVPYDDLQQIYAQYDALLFPSLWAEPFGMVVIQAMARGLPVIATNHGGPAEIITDGVDGLLVPPGSDAALAAATMRLASDPALARRLRLAALETVRSRYTLERVADETERRMLAILAANHTLGMGGGRRTRPGGTCVRP